MKRKLSYNPDEVDFSDKPFPDIEKCCESANARIKILEGALKEIYDNTDDSRICRIVVKALNIKP